MKNKLSFEYLEGLGDIKILGEFGGWHQHNWYKSQHELKMHTSHSSAKQKDGGDATGRWLMNWAIDVPGQCHTEKARNWPHHL